MANEEPNDLLNALESIKGLLEQSESKLNAAKESVKLAAPKPLPLPEVEEFDDDDDEPFDVPVLDDIVIPATTEGARPTVDIEVLKAFLDEMQSKIEKTMRDTLMKAVVQAETDIKKQMRAYLNQLRKMLNEE
jgi:hypothetical protein